VTILKKGEGKADAREKEVAQGQNIRK
jgi:hypothetical protein